MLARNAEALYWIGRYVERADDTARILDVTVHQLLEDSTVDPDQASRILLQVMGFAAPEARLDMWALTDMVAFSRGASRRVFDHRRHHRREGERPLGARGHLRRHVGMPQHHLQRTR